MDELADDQNHDLGPGVLRTPFSAAQIRDASRAGKVIRLLVELEDGSSFERVNRFRDGDDEGATLDQWQADSADEVSSRRVTWRELQGHAAFPIATTTATNEVLELPLGRLECLRYDCAATQDEPAMTFWFALAHPGMPVRFDVDGSAGATRTTVLSIDTAG